MQRFAHLRQSLCFLRTRRQLGVDVTNALDQLVQEIFDSLYDLGAFGAGLLQLYQLVLQIAIVEQLLHRVCNNFMESLVIADISVPQILQLLLLILDPFIHGLAGLVVLVDEEICKHLVLLRGVVLDKVGQFVGKGVQSRATASGKGIQIDVDTTVLSGIHAVRRIVQIALGIPEHPLSVDPFGPKEYKLTAQAKLVQELGSIHTGLLLGSQILSGFVKRYGVTLHVGKIYASGTLGFFARLCGGLRLSLRLFLLSLIFCLGFFAVGIQLIGLDLGYGKAVQFAFTIPVPACLVGVDSLVDVAGILGIDMLRHEVRRLHR